MKNIILIVSAFFLTLSIHATQIAPKTLIELMKDTDHVIIAKVTKVDMIDKDGKEVKNLDARTGPGETNEIRLHIKVVKNKILKTNAHTLPEALIIPLWY